MVFLPNSFWILLNNFAPFLIVVVGAYFKNEDWGFILGKWQKMTLEFELNKMGSPIPTWQIRDSPKFVLNEICDFMIKKVVNGDSQIVICDT